MDVCAYWFWLVSVFVPADRRIWTLGREYASAAEFAEALINGRVKDISSVDAERIRKLDLRSAEQAVAEYESRGIKVYCYESEGYPERLRETSNPPAVIFVKGSLDFLDDSLAVCIAGAREPSEYSVTVTEMLSSKLAKSGCVIVSGLSPGTDTLAVKAACDEGSPALGVSGVAIEHYYDDDTANMVTGSGGAIISELCDKFDMRVPHFGERNRIMAALVDAVVYIEGSAQSKGLDICARAIAQGKDLLVVPPHDITDPRYSGQAALLRKGCIPVFSEQDVLFCVAHEGIQRLGYDSVGYRSAEDYSFFRESFPAAAHKVQRKPKQERSAPAAKLKDISSLEGNVKNICTLLADGPLLADVIASRLGLDISEVLAALTMLELNGYVLSLPGKRYARA